MHESCYSDNIDAYYWYYLIYQSLESLEPEASISVEYVPTVDFVSYFLTHFSDHPVGLFPPLAGIYYLIKNNRQTEIKLLSEHAFEFNKNRNLVVLKKLVEASENYTAIDYFIEHYPDKAISAISSVDRVVDTATKETQAIRFILQSNCPMAISLLSEKNKNGVCWLSLWFNQGNSIHFYANRGIGACEWALKQIINLQVQLNHDFLSNRKASLTKFLRKLVSVMYTKSIVNASDCQEEFYCFIKSCISSQLSVCLDESFQFYLYTTHT